MVKLQEIFEDNWDEFIKVHKVRPVVDSEIRKIIGCGKDENGFTLMNVNAETLRLFPFGANLVFAIVVATNIKDTGRKRLNPSS